MRRVLLLPRMRRQTHSKVRSECGVPMCPGDMFGLRDGVVYIHCIHCVNNHGVNSGYAHVII